MTKNVNPIFVLRCIEATGNAVLVHSAECIIGDNGEISKEYLGTIKGHLGPHAATSFEKEKIFHYHVKHSESFKKTSGDINHNVGAQKATSIL